MSGSEGAEQIPITVIRGLRVRGAKAVIRFVNDWIIITYLVPSRPVRMTFRPKEFVRQDPVTIRVNSGFWKFQWLTIRFDSEEDAGKVELKLREILPGKTGLNSLIVRSSS
jgi:hypothetical protein